MFNIEISNIKENQLYHFTKKENLEKISVEGLKPQIGENSKYIENTPKIFFSKGTQGILKSTEVWLRWLMNRIYGPKNIIGIYNQLSKEDKIARLSKWQEEFLSKDYLKDNIKKEVLFNYFYNYTKERVYLVLNLDEEYIENDIDEVKQNLIKNKQIDYYFAKEMYADFSNMDSEIVDDWNMHTKREIEVSPKKISILSTNSGKNDMLSIIIEIYDKENILKTNDYLIKDFIKYAKKRLKNEKSSDI